MVEREIIWTETANKQLQNILEYWLDKNASQNYSQVALASLFELENYLSRMPQNKVVEK